MTNDKSQCANCLGYHEEWCDCHDYLREERDNASHTAACLRAELTAANARIAELELLNQKLQQENAALDWADALKILESRRLRIAELEALLGEAPHSETCASRKTYMAGGISFDVNVRPDAREVRPPCNCLKSRA